MTIARLEILLLEAAVGHLDSDAVKAAIASCMAQGLWVDAFTDALSPADLRGFEAFAVLESSAHQLGIPPPEPHTVVQRLLRHYLTDIAEGVIAPRAGMEKVVQRIPREEPQPPCRYLGESRGLHHLIGCYWSYGDLEERPAEVSYAGQFGDAAIRGLDQAIVSLAQQWLARQR